MKPNLAKKFDTSVEDKVRKDPEFAVRLVNEYRSEVGRMNNEIRTLRERIEGMSLLLWYAVRACPAHRLFIGRDQLLDGMTPDMELERTESVSEMTIMFHAKCKEK